MARKDISDLQVLRAYEEFRAALTSRCGNCATKKYASQVYTPRCRQCPPVFHPEEILQRVTGQCEKVCYAAMERACGRKLIDYGVSLRGGFLTDAGREFLEKQ